MKSTYRSRPDAPPGAGVVLPVVSVLATANILTNRVLPDWAYVPFNVLVTLVLVALARRCVAGRELGVGAWRAGAVWGGAVVAVALVAFLAAARLPGLSDLFEDERVDGGTGRMLYETLVRIPFGTVLVEEVAFRGALPALFGLRMGTWRAYGLASLLFGLWHVLPAWTIDDVNPVVDRLLGDGWVGQASGIVLAVIGTVVAGLWLCVLRHRSGSLLAPALAHVGTNSLGFAIAWLSMR